MGYGIFVVQLRFDKANHRAFFVKTVDETELSFNWCDMEHYWSVKDDMLERHSSDVEARLRRAIQALEDDGIKTGVPDPSNPDWGWGCRWNPDWKSMSDQIISLPIDERFRIFLYHLRRLLKVAQSNPDAFFLDENFIFNTTKISHQGEDYTLDFKSDKEISKDKCDNGDIKDNGDEENESDSGTVVYYRHPFNGTMRVDTFVKAMEIYGFAKASNDPRMESWWNLALTLPGAPSVKK